MVTPDKIYLIDMGDDVTWCDDPNPSGTVDQEDVVGYTKNTIIKDLEADLKESRLLYRDAKKQFSEQIEATHKTYELELKEAKEEIEKLKDEYGEFREYHHYKIIPKLNRYETALKQIAQIDYRGNKHYSIQIAQEALKNK